MSADPQGYTVFAVHEPSAGPRVMRFNNFPEPPDATRGTYSTAAGAIDAWEQELLQRALAKAKRLRAEYKEPR